MRLRADQVLGIVGGSVLIGSVALLALIMGTDVLDVAIAIAVLGLVCIAILVSLNDDDWGGDDP